RVVLSHDVVNRQPRKVALQRLPVIAVVEGHVYAELAAGVEYAASSGNLAHDADEVSSGDSTGNAAPRLAVVGRLEDVRLEVLELVPRRGDIGGPGVVRRRLER